MSEFILFPKTFPFLPHSAGWP